MPDEPHVVIATVDPGWAALGSALGAAGFVASVVEPDAAVATVGAAAAGAVACVVVDAAPGVDALVRALRSRTTAPIVVVCAAGDIATERELVDAGATDWLAPGDRSAPEVARRLRRVVRGAGAEARAAAALAVARDASRVRDDVLAIVAHDLRAPLRSIRLACTELADDLPFADAARYIGAIERAARRGDGLIGELLDLVAIENGGLHLARRELDIRALVRRTCVDHDLIASSTGARIVATLPDDPVRVVVDPDWIVRVLANLIGNALVHAGGAAVDVEVTSTADAVTIAVTDDGRGIAADELPHLFDRFWQGRVRRGGAGLGLALAKGVVEAHGGTITAANVPSRGARFAFNLPRAT